MQIGYRTIGLGLIGLAVVIAAAYNLGLNQGGIATALPQPPHLGKGTPQTLDPHAALPANHPSATNNMEQVVEREGKVTVPKGAKFVHFRVGNRNVKDLYSDDKRLWVGTSGGAIRYDTSNDEFRLFDTKSGLLSNGVFHVSKFDGRMLVGTYGGGMALYDEAKDRWDTFNIPDGLADAFVYDVLKLRNGDLWIATWSGANRVVAGALKDRSKWQVFTVENTKGGLPNDWVYGLAEGKNGELWLATEGGLARFSDGNWQNWNHEKGLGADFERVKNDLQFKNDPAQYSAHHAKQKQEMGLQGVNVAYNPNYIVSLAVDRDGIVWAGTWGGGLSRFDGSSWRSYTVQEGLPGNHVFMLHLDAKGDLWIGTNNGLAKRQGEKFQIFTTSDGLFSNTVFSMTTAPDGSLWVGSYGGVAHLTAIP